jgi:tRNA (cmo5U34)-methyltransferase
MTKFNQSEWKDSKHVKEFIENSDNYILERKRQVNILKSFYNYFLPNKPNGTQKILDLGCGDGRISIEILKLDRNVDLFLVDGSLEMLEEAKSNLRGYENIQYINESFQNIMEKDGIGKDFNLIISSLAIHHLSTLEKKSFYKYIYNKLEIGGFFINMDVVLSPTEQLEEWYLMLWNEWIHENENELGNENSFQHLPLQYKNNPDNHPETLGKQLNELKKIGFKNVDCFYKYGIFSIYGGKK